jgi:uncharacterized protein (DUF1015 family)
MAEIEPLHALHYAPGVVGSLSDVVSPPYDVIDEVERARLAARSPFNVVHIDLPEPTDSEPDRYAVAARTLSDWRRDGAVVTDPEPALWALRQDYRAPDGRSLTRRGLLCRVRVQPYGAGRIRAHERTHPGPKEDRLRLTRATRANLSPVFALYDDPQRQVAEALGPHVAGQPREEVTDGQGTSHALWRVADRPTATIITRALRDAELLIADGHHRYETARVYAEESGTEAANYVLVCLVALQDPGLTIFPIHRLLRDLDDARLEALRRVVEANFTATPVEESELVPAPDAQAIRFGFLDAAQRHPVRLQLRDPAIAQRALAEAPEPVRRLDTAVLEALILREALGMSDEDIDHLNGLAYANRAEDALAQVGQDGCQAAFFLAPTPVDQVREIAATGRSMPPKSTFFHPKIPTGLVFNPLDDAGAP